MNDIDDMTDERRKLAADHDRYYTPVAASDLPREISRDELQALPEGAIFQRVTTQEYLGGGTSRVLDVRFRLISLPEPEPDPDQPLIDALAASGLTEAQARDALDAIHTVAVTVAKRAQVTP